MSNAQHSYRVPVFVEVCASSHEEAHNCVLRWLEAAEDATEEIGAEDPEGAYITVTCIGNLDEVALIDRGDSR